MRGFRDRAEVDAALAMLDQRVRPLPAEAVDVTESSGRVLAVDIVAEISIPGFDRAAMDGYALRGEETFGATAYNPLECHIVGESRPGRGFSGKVEPGQAVRIMTGAPIPQGADAVLMAEAAEVQRDLLRVTEAVPPGRHVGPAGEDIVAGTPVLRAGRVLRPQDAAVLAALGIGRVTVVRRPSVAILITGDELLPPGSRPEGCRIVDSNSVMLAALVRRDGGVTQVGPIIPDRREAVRDALQNTSADAVLVSGGSSVGPEDHAPAVLAELGELAVHGIAMRPSSPTGIGFLAGKGDWPPNARGQSPFPADRPVFLLPGNPVSCLAAYDFFAGPAIRRLGGRSMDWPYHRIQLPLGRKVVSAVGRVDYVRVKIQNGQVEPIATSGASILSSTTQANGFLIVPRDREGYGSGEMVAIYLYDG
jgi:molybdopterin molybdotransferase